jgi:hypothetical protein
MVADRRREVDATCQSGEARPEKEPGAGRTALDPGAVTIRFASRADAQRLERLAAIDSGPVPTGPTLVAEVDGELVAALPVGHGRGLADPFRPSVELIRLLELREAQLRGTDRRRRRSFGHRSGSGQGKLRGDRRPLPAFARDR